MSEPPPAEEPEFFESSFSERVTAFTLDGALFSVLMLVHVAAVNGGLHVLAAPQGQKISILWTALFVVYNALFWALGTPTLGKAALGLRVVDGEGRPLPAGRALLRALAYFPSSLFAGGFLLPLFRGDGRALHDLLSDSHVVCAAPRPPKLVRFAAALSLMVLGGAWFWQNLAAPNHYRKRTVAAGEKALRSLAILQETHKRDRGSYTDDLSALAGLTADPDAYLAAVSKGLDADRGLVLELYPGDSGYLLKAWARDRRHTPVRLIGPLKDL